MIRDLWAFRSSAISKIVFPGSLRVIDKYAFAACKELTEVLLPEGLISIEDAAFRECEALMEVVFPLSCILIGAKAFEGCTNLSNVVISGKHTTVGSGAFLKQDLMTNLMQLLQMLADSAAALVLEGITTVDELNRVAYSIDA